VDEEKERTIEVQKEGKKRVLGEGKKARTDKVTLDPHRLLEKKSRVQKGMFRSYGEKFLLNGGGGGSLKSRAGNTYMIKALGDRFNNEGMVEARKGLRY